MPDGVDFDVKTTHVVLPLRQPGNAWSNARPAVKDFDGWHDEHDLAGSDHEWAHSKPVNLNCAGG